MNLSCEQLSTDLAGPDGWDFGHLPYGLEPLFLPRPRTPDEMFGWPPPGPGDGNGDGPGARPDLNALCPALLAHAEPDRPARAPGGAAPGLRVYWFRWITGHQVSFVFWRLLAEEMAVASIDDRERGAAAMAAYVRGYCAMLLYTGSCPRDVYEGLIRPTMFLQHPGFSGSWAADFGPVRHLFRRRHLPWPEGPETADLKRALGMYQMIHAGVAARLVPHGRSLLQAATATEIRNPELFATVYDNYFLTVRSAASADEVVTQLLRRLEAMALDLAANGLYAAGEPDDRPAELHGDDVIECEHDLPGVLLRAARHATADVGVQV